MSAFKRHILICFLIAFGSSGGSPLKAADELSSKARPLSAYAASVQKQVAPVVASKCDWDDTVGITAALDEKGNIVETGKGTGARHDKAAEIIRSIGSLPSPPPGSKSPFWLMFTISHKADKVSVAYRDVDYATYMANLQRRIKSKWVPLKGKESTQVKVHFKVFSDGKMEGLKIAKSSGDKAIDEVALMATNAAQPFEPLPDGSPSDVDIEFNFAYNVHNQQSRSPAAEAALSIQYGVTAMGTKNYPLAIQFFEKAATLEPKNLEARKNLGNAYKAQAIYDLKTYPEQSMINFKKAKQLWPEISDVPETLEQAKTMYGSK